MRQGCALSPVVWSIFTGLLLNEYHASIQHDVVAPEITAFADDMHSGWLLDKPEELPIALSQVQSMLSLLERFGLKANPGKSKAILRVQGAEATRLRSSWCYKVKNDSYLRLPSKGERIGIPLTSKIAYMGIVLSYDSFEKQTITKRIGVAQGSYERLRRILNNRTTLNLQQRIRIWRVTVLPALFYGTIHIMLTRELAERIHGLCMRHLRAISNSPLHITGESNENLLLRLGVQYPIAMLHTQHLKRAQKLHILAQSSQHDPMMCSSPMLAWMEECNVRVGTYAALYEAASTTHPDQVPATAAQSFVCDVCSRAFATESSLRQHISKTHLPKPKSELPKVADPEAEVRKYGTDGMPTCRFCHEKFSKSHALQRHITLQRCTQMPQSVSPTVSDLGSMPTASCDSQCLQHDAEFLQAFKKSGSSILHKFPSQIERAKHHCCLCNQWLIRDADFKSHYKRSHQSIWEKYGVRATRLVGSLPMGSQCTLCGSKTGAKTRHSCPVLLQLHLATLLHGERREHDDTTPISGGAGGVRTPDCSSGQDGNGGTAHPGQASAGGGERADCGEQAAQTFGSTEDTRNPSHVLAIPSSWSTTSTGRPELATHGASDKPQPPANAPPEGGTRQPAVCWKASSRKEGQQQSEQGGARRPVGHDGKAGAQARGRARGGKVRQGLLSFPTQLHGGGQHHSPAVQGLPDMVLSVQHVSRYSEWVQ